jgi:hypothetical protein
MALGVAACGGSAAPRAARVPVLRAKGDQRILELAFILESVESAFYDQVVVSGQLEGQWLEVAKRFGDNELEHVDALTATIQQLGGTAPPKPATRFELAGARSILEQAVEIETLGASAYLGAAPLIENKSVLVAALAIHSVEHRHAAALKLLLGRPIVGATPFAEPLAADVVLRRVTKYLEPA